MRGFDTRLCSWIFSATCEECSRLLVSVFGLTLWAERFRVLKVLARTSARRVASVSSQVTANRSVRDVLVAGCDCKKDHQTLPQAYTLLAPRKQQWHAPEQTHGTHSPSTAITDTGLRKDALELALLDLINLHCQAFHPGRKPQGGTSMPPYTIKPIPKT